MATALKEGRIGPDELFPAVQAPEPTGNAGPDTPPPEGEKTPGQAFWESVKTLKGQYKPTILKYSARVLMYAETDPAVYDLLRDKWKRHTDEAWPFDKKADEPIIPPDEEAAPPPWEPDGAPGPEVAPPFPDGNKELTSFEFRKLANELAPQISRDDYATWLDGKSDSSDFKTSQYRNKLAELQELVRFTGEIVCPDSGGDDTPINKKICQSCPSFDGCPAWDGV